ncbi:hypothetical protein ANO14919_063730 [Xylariales sp. No.14919]|nr:hypothetical protein ANO14919_063730 [Xylariales sp. No.14919]
MLGSQPMSSTLDGWMFVPVQWTAKIIAPPTKSENGKASLVVVVVVVVVIVFPLIL